MQYMHSHNGVAPHCGMPLPHGVRENFRQLFVMMCAPFGIVARESPVLKAFVMVRSLHRFLCCFSAYTSCFRHIMRCYGLCFASTSHAPAHSIELRSICRPQYVVHICLRAAVQMPVISESAVDAVKTGDYTSSH